MPEFAVAAQRLTGLVSTSGSRTVVRVNSMVMALNFGKVLVLLQGIMLLGLLSGCEVLAFVTTEVYATESVYRDPTYTGVNHYEPVIINSDNETIRVKYLDINSYAQPEKAVQLIEDHCDGPFVETNREKNGGMTIIEARCTN